MLGFWLVLAGVAAASAVAALHKRAEERRTFAWFRELQRQILVPARYRTPTDADRILFDALPTQDVETLAHDLTWLADFVLELDDEAFAVKVFIDVPRTTVAYVTGSSTLAAESYTADVEIMTLRGTGRGWTQPPFRDTITLNDGTSPSEVLQAHHARLDDKELKRIESPDDLVPIWTEFQRREIDWRTNLAPDDLIEMDVRALLGESYAQADPGKLRRMRPLRANLPKAKLRTTRRE